MGIYDELKRRNVFRVVVAYTIVAWLVAQIADLVLNNIGAPEWVMPALFLMLVLGFFAALVISWAYELTPDGVKRERDVIRDDSITQITAKKLDYITIAAVIGVVVMFMLQPHDNGQAGTTATTAVLVTDSTRESAEPRDQSIAVLPFANRSNQDEDLFFTDGIHDDLLTQLAKINDLKVISRTSVMQYRETDKQIPQIARELGVATILEGGVQRAGHRIRINAQLIDVATDEHLWAETFDREMTIDNLFDIQTEITRHIVTAVKGRLTTEEQKAISVVPTQSLEAYEAYLRARNLLSSTGYNLDKYLAAEPYTKQALALDPNFALAHLQLSDIHGNLVWIGYDVTPEREQAALAALDSAAVLLDSGSPELSAAQGEFLYRFKSDFVGAERAFQEAHTAMPGSAVVLEQIGYTQRRLGQWEQSVSSLLSAAELDPANASAMTGATETLRMMQQWSRLEDALLKARERFGDDTEFAVEAAMLPLHSKGDVVAARERYTHIRSNSGENYFNVTVDLPWYERDFHGVIKAWQHPAIQEYGSLAGLTGYRQLQMAMAYRFLGEVDRAELELRDAIRLLTNMDGNRPNQIIAYELGILAQVLALLDEEDRAIEIAEEATELLSVQSDAVDGPWMRHILCWVLAKTGEYDRALEIVAEQIDKPAGFNRWDLYLDPRWDFFRDDERFNDLIRPHNLAQATDE